jgi:hypothetical protein
LNKQKEELLKLKEHVDKSLRALVKEQRNIEKKLGSNEKSTCGDKTFVERKTGSPLCNLMRRCGSPINQYSHIQPRVFAHLPEDKRPRPSLSRSPKPNEKFQTPV